MIDSGVLPAPGPDDAFFWEGLRDGRTLLQRCASCSRVRFPASPRCTHCGAPESETVEASGTGTVYSWIVAHRGFHAAFESSVPFIIATVDLDEGARIVGELRDPTEPMEAGRPVRIAYEAIGEFTRVCFVEASVT